MLKILIALAFIAASAAHAQAPEFTFKLTAQEADVVAQGLSELPIKTAAPVLNKLRDQFVEQQKAKAAPDTVGSTENPAK